MKLDLRRADWTLLALAAAEGAPLTPVQLQKTVFLLSQAAAKTLGEQLYQFAPYDYGPYDASVYRDAESLEGQGLVSVTRDGRWRVYAATPAGVDRASKIAAQVPPTLLDYLRSVVKWARGLSFQDLVRAIYKDYPEYRVNSVFKD